MGQRWGGIVNVAWPSPNWPPVPGDRAAVYAIILTTNGSQEGLQLPHVVLWAHRVLQGLSTKYPGLFLVKVGYVRGSATTMASGSAARIAKRWGGARLLLLHACESGLPHGRPREHVCVRFWLLCSLPVAIGLD